MALAIRIADSHRMTEPYSDMLVCDNFCRTHSHSLYTQIVCTTKLPIAIHKGQLLVNVVIGHSLCRSVESYIEACMLWATQFKPFFIMTPHTIANLSAPAPTTPDMEALATVAPSMRPQRSAIAAPAAFAECAIVAFALRRQIDHIASSWLSLTAYCSAPCPERVSWRCSQVLPCSCDYQHASMPPCLSFRT